MHTCLCNRNRVNSIKQTFWNMEKALHISWNNQYSIVTSHVTVDMKLQWRVFQVIMAFLELFCEVTLGPLCEVKVWLFPENCDICSGSPSGRVTRFYPNRKSCESAVFSPSRSDFDWKSGIGSGNLILANPTRVRPALAFHYWSSSD